MNISPNKVVSLSYILRSSSADGEVLETVASEHPLDFIYGIGNMLPKFEENILGLKAGESFDFSLTSDDAYGAFSSDALVDLSKEMFKVNGEIQADLLVLGNVIPMQDAEGNRYRGTVKEIHDDFIKIDFNHPLAGVTLFFKGSIEAVREATPEEIANGFLGKAGGGCGCGSGGCGSSEEASSCGSGGCGCEPEAEMEKAGSCGSGCGCN